MARSTPDHTQHWIRTIRRYTDNLRAQHADGEPFTTDEVEEIGSILDDMEALHESATDTSGPGEAGGNAQNP